MSTHRTEYGPENANANLGIRSHTASQHTTTLQSLLVSVFSQSICNDLLTVLEFLDSLKERLTLDLGNLQLKSRRLSGAVATSKGTGTVRRRTVDLLQVGDLGESLGVTQRHKDDTVVNQHRQGVHNSGLLATAGGTGGHKDTGSLTVEGTRSPKTSGGVPESLPLSRVTAKSGGDTEQERVVLGQGVQSGNWVVGSGRSVHLLQNLLRQCLRNLIDVSLTAGSLDTLLDRLGQGSNVVVQRVDDDSNFGSHCDCFEAGT